MIARSQLILLSQSVAVLVDTDHNFEHTLTFQHGKAEMGLTKSRDVTSWLSTL